MDGGERVLYRERCEEKLQSWNGKCAYEFEYKGFEKWKASLTGYNVENDSWIIFDPVFALVKGWRAQIGKMGDVIIWLLSSPSFFREVSILCEMLHILPPGLILSRKFRKDIGDLRGKLSLTQYWSHQE